MPQERYSNDLKDIMGKIPGWMIRWGISLIFILFVLVLTITYFIKYPEVIVAPIELTTINPPADLMAKSTGKIERLLIPNGESVKQDSIVAIIFNTADYKSVILVERYIESHDSLGHYYKDTLLNKEYQLGELQNYYTQFVKLCKTYNHYIEQNHIAKKRSILQKQITKTKSTYANQNRQLQLMYKDLEFEINNLKRDSLLYENKVLSSSELEKTQQAYLQKEMSIVTQETSLTYAESNILDMEEQLLELNIQYEDDITQYNIQFDEYRDQLLAQIKLWEEKYVVISPIDGIVNYTKFWSENQNVTIGERVATVVPVDSMQVIGKMFIPSTGFAKVHIGQQVNIKLNGFPYMEYGMLKGMINNLAAVPEEEGYAAEVIFPNGMVSSYKKQFGLIQQMDGTGEVITQDMRLIERFLQPIKALLHNNITTN